MFDFYETKFKQINSLKYLMTLGARSQGSGAYKEKLLEVFKEIEEFISEEDNYNIGNENSIDGAFDNRGDKVFTLEELAMYNGQNGNPAYVAVNGLVYDLSSAPAEILETHKGIPLGSDLSADFSNCHNDNISLLKSITIVGKLMVSREIKEFTIDELAKYNGQNGMMKYIAIDGKVYDVTGITLFNKKPHSSLQFGTDLTEQLKQCHNEDMNLLNKLTQVGILVGSQNTLDHIPIVTPEVRSKRFL